MLGSSVGRRLSARFFRNISIKRKLTLITMITSTVTLLLAGAAYVTYDLVTFRQAMTRDLLILAEIIGTNSTGALAFDDPKAGAATLASLQAEEHIVSACLYVKTGTLFAAYHRGRERSDVRAGDACRLSGAGYLAVTRPIVFDGDAIGTISIESDLQAFYSRLMRYASIGVVVIFASSVVGWLLSIQLQRVISGPMLDLVQTARTVSDRMDYSVRAVKRTEDEVGLLIDSFNQMLTQIEKRDAALTTLSNNLDQLYRLSTAMQEPLSLREHLTRVLEAARQVVAIDRFYVWALAPGGDRVSALAGAGFATDEWKDFENIEIPLVDAGAMYKAYLEGVPLVFNEENPLPPELRLRPPYAELQAIRTTRFIVIPMIARGRPVGLFTADNKRSREPILSSTVDLLQIFVSHAAVAIENARLFHEIEDKGRQLEIASRHKSQFLANMSHELRTPLNAVLGYTELILDNIFGEVPPQIRDTLERTRSSGLHLLGLINDVLDLSKIEAGHLVLSLGEYSMGEAVHIAVSSLRSLAEEKHLALKSVAAPDLPPGKGDERRIAQVLLNLVGNAIKFTEVGQVTVEATAAEGSFLVSVSDTGSGISSADQQKIFEEFQQADSSSTRKKGGTGLGLSIARRIIALHGGRIWVESSPGHGSTFRFTLPVRVEAQEEIR